MSATETKATHTPGPWAVDGEGAHVARVSSAVEITAPTVSRFDRPDEGRIDADARLMAAAPDMLAACKAALPWVAIVNAFSDQETTHPKAIQNAEDDLATIRAAIAKAEGRW